MKILITTGIFKPEVGGPATYVAELARRFYAAGHPVTIITYSDKAAFGFDAEYPFPLIRVVRHRNKLVNYIKYFFAVLKQVPHHDFIYSLDWFSVGMPILFASFLTKKKYIVRVGGGYIWEKYLAENRPPLTLRQFYAEKLYKNYKLLFFLIKRVLKGATHVVFNSHEQQQIYQTYYKLAPSKTSVIYNPVPENKLGSLVRDYKQDHGERDKEIVFAGRFIRMKNVASLIRAFALLKDTSYTLLLIGSGPTEQELRTLVVELGLADRVTFMPSLSLQELYRRISNCKYVVLPSWTDISPNQIYECMALGIPFLLTKENYLAINKEKFLTIDPTSVADIAEKMNALLDADSYKKFVTSLAHISFSYSWNDVIVAHMKLFTRYIKAV